MSSTALVPRVQARPVAVARPKSRVRLTRRGRIVVFAVGMLVAFALGVWLAAGSTATDSAGAEQAELVTVAPGDTLWDIASDAAAVTGESNVGDMVERIRDMNSLDSSVVYAGQELRVPAE